MSDEQEQEQKEKRERMAALFNELATLRSFWKEFPGGTFIVPLSHAQRLDAIADELTSLTGINFDYLRIREGNQGLKVSRPEDN